jgi:hypothetical protein
MDVGLSGGNGYARRLLETNLAPADACETDLTITPRIDWTPPDMRRPVHPADA